MSDPGKDIPFALIWEANEKRIPFIEAGQSTNITFNIIAFSDSIAKTYKIPIILNYYDTHGKSYTKEIITSLQVETE